MLATTRHMSLKGVMNSVYKIPSYFFKIHLISSSRLGLDFPSGILTSAFSNKNCNVETTAENIQGVPRVKVTISGECSLGQTIPI